MARKSFDEALRERRKAKENGTYQSTVSEEEKGNDISFEEAIEKRRAAIKKKTYTGTVEEKGAQITSTSNQMYRIDNSRKNRQQVAENISKDRDETLFGNRGVSYHDYKKQYEQSMNKMSGQTVTYEQAKKLAEQETENPYSGLTNRSYGEYLAGVLDKAEGETEKYWVKEQVKNLEELRDEMVRKYVGQATKWYKDGIKPKLKEATEAVSELKGMGYSNEQINSMMDTYVREENASATGRMLQQADEETGSFWGDVGASVKSLGTMLASGVGILETGGAWLKEKLTGEYTPVDTNSAGHMLGKYTSRVRQNVTKDIEGDKNYTEEDERNIELLQNPDIRNYIEQIDKFYRQGNKIAVHDAKNAFQAMRDMGYSAKEINSMLNTYLYDGVPVVRKALGGIYNAGMSVGDNATAMGAGSILKLANPQNFALAALSTEAAAGTSADVFERTGSTEQAFATGIASGAVEALTEKISLDNLWDMLQGQGKAATRSMLVNWIVQSGIEGSEEGVSEIANNIIDRAINQHESEYEINVQNYINNGMNEEQAREQANKDFQKQVEEAVKMGVLAGGISGGFGTAALGLRRAAAGNSIRKSGQSDAMIERAGTYEDAKVQEALRKYQEHPSDYAAGRLMNEMQIAEEIMKKRDEKEGKNQKKEENTDESADMQVSRELDAEESLSRMNHASNAEELVDARRYVEENGTPEQTETAQRRFDYQKARMISEGQENEDAFIKAEEKKTLSEAYELGTQNAEVPEEQLSLGGKIRYNEGKEEYLKEEALRRTITDRRMIEQAEAVGSDGKNITVSKLKEVEAEPMLETNTGTIALRDVSFVNTNVQKLYNAASTKGTTAAANMFLKHFPAGMTVNNYETLFDRFENAGELGISFENTLKRNKFAETQIGRKGLREIYDVGKEKNNTKENQEHTVERKGTGKVIDKRKSKTKEPLMDLYVKLAEKTGIDITLKDSDMDDINGSFEKAVSEIVLNTESNTYAAAMHELGEFTDLWNEEGMRNFQTAFLEWYFDEYQDTDEMVRKYKRVYEQVEGSKSLREAADEMMRDGLSGLFGTEEGARDFTKWLSENRTQQEAKNIIQTITDFLKNLCDKIMAYIDRNGLSGTAEAAMRMEADKAEQLRKQFLDAADKAIENYQKAETGKTGKTESVTKYSLVGVDENGIEVYETSEDTKKLNYKQRKAKLLDYMKNEFKGRTAKFTKNGQVYYAQYTHDGTKKGVYGDKKSSKKGIKAKINIGADGNYIELAENALYKGTSVEQGKTNKFHSNAKNWDYYIKTIKSDETYFDVLINVKDTGNGQYVYDITLKEADSLPGQSRPYDGSLTASNSSVPQNKKNATENSDIRYSITVDNQGTPLSEMQMQRFKNAKTVDEQGRLKRYYHGTARGDRVGTYFDPERATSGPMAFFTDSKEIATNYSRDKEDTSIAYESEYDSYETQFRVERDGEDMSIIDLWYTLSQIERAEIKEKGKHITLDYDGDYDVIYDEETTHGLGNYDDYEFKMHRGNALSVLVDSWLNGGNIFGQEEMFLDVLRLVGIEDARYMNPDYREEKVYETYLNITNPFDTSDVDEEFLADIYDWLDATDLSYYEKESANADMWDKNDIDPYDWAERIQDDIERGTTHAWTSIPDVITDFLKSQGYDGIFDSGGKNGGAVHQVVIPFYSAQIKEVTNLNPTDNPDIRYSLNINDYLSKEEQGEFWNKIGQRKSGTVFPKSRNGDSILIIGNKLVYTGKGYINPKVNQIVEVIVQEDSEYESTYTSFIQEDIINGYERDGSYKNTSVEEYAEFNKNSWSYGFGRKVDIKTNTPHNNGANGENGLAGKGQVRERVSYHFEDQQERGRGNKESGASEGIRHQLNGTSDLEFLWESYDGFDDVVKKSASILEQGAKAMQGKEVNRKLVHKIAWHIKQDYRSGIDLETLTDNLVKVFSYMQTQEKANYEDLVWVMNEVAQPVLEESNSYDPDEQKQYSEFKKNLKSIRIKLSDRQKAEVAEYYDSYESFRRKMFGTITLAEDGQYLDSVWSEIVDFSNGYLDLNANYAEQAIILADAIQMMKPQLHNNFGVDNHGVAMDLSLGIYEEYFKAQADSRVQAIQRKMVHERAVWHDKVRKEYYKKLSQERERMKEKTGTIEKRVAEVRAAYTASELDKKKKQKSAQYRQNIKRTGAQLIKWIESPTDKQHVPEKLKKTTLEFLSAIDFISHRALDNSNSTISWREKMRSVYGILSEAEKSDNVDEYGSFLMDIDPDFLPTLNQFVENNKGVEKISLMDYSQLKELNTMMNSLKRTITRANEFIANENFQYCADAANKDIRELQKKKDRNTGNELLQTLKELNFHMLDARSFFETIGEGAKSIYRSIRTGFDTRTWHILEAQKYMEEVLKDIDKKELKKWTGDHAEVREFRVKDGILKLNPSQVMSLYLHQRRTQSMRHILAGGVVASEIKAGKKKYAQTRPVHLTKAQLQEIIGTLTPEQKRVADRMQRFLAVNCAEWGNRASMKMYGYKKFMDDMYFPIKTYGGQIASSDKNNNTEASLYAIRNQGCTKNISKDAKNAIMLEDIMDVFTKHVVGMANYDAFAAPLSDSMKWFNYQNGGMVGEDFTSETMKEEMERVYGKEAENYFIRLIKDINGEVSKESSTRISDILTSNYKAAAVMANVRVVLQQPTAYMRASLLLSPVDMLKSLARNPADGVKKAKKNSAIANWKSLGYYETSMGQSMKSIITGQQSLSDKIRDKGGMMAQMADEVTWGYLWNACESEIARMNPDMRSDSEKFRQKVTERFDDVIDQTQVVDTILHRSQIMRSKSLAIKWEVAFMSEPHKSYNMLYRAGAEGKKQFGKTAIVYAMTGVFTSMAAALADAWRDDEFEKGFKERYTGQLLENMEDNLNPFGMIPYVKDIINLADGYDVERMDMAGFARLVEAIRELPKFIIGDSKKTGYGMAKLFARPISQITGIPAYNIMRETEVILENMMQEPIAERKDSTGDMYKKLIKYGEENDTENYNKTYEKLLESGKDEKKIRAGVRTKVNSMFKKGELTEDEAAEILEAWDYDDVYEIIDKWKENMEK